MIARLRQALSVAVAACVLVVAAGPASADGGPNGWLVGNGGTDGLRIAMTETQTQQLPEQTPGPGVPTVRFEYTTEVACHAATTDPGSVACIGASMACPAGTGPLHWILQRPAGTPAWTTIGSTCFPDAVPGARPTPSIETIRRAFHDTPWAVPAVSTQPAGNITLVGLDTYWLVTWSSTGIAPGMVRAIDPTLMFGHTVRIRPVLQGYTYQFGDGQSEGPTTSPGGIYPDGDVIHVYRDIGAYGTRVDVVLTGDFSVDAGPWIRIPDTATVTGPTTTVLVREARAELINPERD